jgi:hypothetical protein
MIFDCSFVIVTPLLTAILCEAIVGEVCVLLYGIMTSPNGSLVLFVKTETVSVQLRHLPLSETDEYVDLLVQSVKSGMYNLRTEVHERNFANVLIYVSHNFHDFIFMNQSLADYLSIFEHLKKSRDMLLYEIMQFEYCCLCRNKTSKEFMSDAVISFNNRHMPVCLFAFSCVTLPKTKCILVMFMEGTMYKKIAMLRC